MKLRIRDNSVRLRLARGEVDRLRSTGRVQASVSFGKDSALGYVCEAIPGLGSPGASFDGKTVTVRLPTAEVEIWADTDQVSLAAEEVLEDGGTLSLLVEKDFACLKPRAGEDDADMFPHPLEGEQDC